MGGVARWGLPGGVRWVGARWCVFRTNRVLGRLRAGGGGGRGLGAARVGVRGGRGAEGRRMGGGKEREAGGGNQARLVENIIRTHEERKGWLAAIACREFVAL